MYKALIIVLLGLGLAACGDQISQSATGNGTNIVAADDGTNSSTTNEAAEVSGVEDEDGLIYGCSVESEAEGVCSRSPD